MCFSFNHEPKHIKFWDLKNLDGAQRTFTSEAQLYEQLREEIAMTVKKSLISEVPVSLLLSAGLDSSIILHELKNLDQSEQIQTVTVGFNELSYDESQVAKRFATELGFQNTTYLMQETDVPDMLENMVFHLDALNGNPCIFTEYFSFQHAAQKGKVTLTGSGNDEILAGYSTYIADNYRRYYGILPYFLRKWAVSMAQYLPTRDSQYSFDYLAQKFTEGSLFPRPKSHYWWRTIFSDDEKQRLFKREFLRDNPIAFDAFSTYETCYSQVQDSLSFENQNLYADFYRFLIDNANMKVDQLSMAFSLESRPSFLTKRFVEFVFSLPYDFKLRGKQTKYCLRQGYQNRLPDYILHRKKQGSIAPLGFLFRDNMKALLFEVLLSDAWSEMFNLEYIENLLERQIQRRQNNSYKLFALLIFAIWKKHFIDSPTITN
jgi:asparagine synthase (glutamine-hydrolysing)